MRSRWRDVSMREWIDANVRHPDVRELVGGAGARRRPTATTRNGMSAGAAITQVQGALARGVLYLDGGWQTLVDGLRAAAAAAGVRIVASARAASVTRAGAGWSRAAGGRHAPSTAAPRCSRPAPMRRRRCCRGAEQPLLRRWAEAAIPVKAACLDLALARLPQPRATFALGIDRPLYLSVHSAYATLGPRDNAVIHVAKYLGRAASDPRADERELEGADGSRSTPAGASSVLQRRFLPDMLVANALPTAATGGLAGRPGPPVPGADGLYVVGDWVGPHGMLADASLASAKQAATHDPAGRDAARAAPLRERSRRSISQLSASAVGLGGSVAERTGPAETDDYDRRPADQRPTTNDHDPACRRPPTPSSRIAATSGGCATG